MQATPQAPRQTRVKICGLRRLEDIALANSMEHRPDYIGFVFAKSRRQVDFATAQALKAALDPAIQAVGVFVNHDPTEIGTLVRAGVIDVIQLHGSETEADICALKAAHPAAPIVKAVSVRCADDVLAWADSKADYLLLDNGAGGTGQAFDWGVLPQLSGFDKPYFIAGGLTPENVATILPFAPYGIDVSGGVEDKNTGYKDPARVAKLIEIVREENAR